MLSTTKKQFIAAFFKDCDITFGAYPDGGSYVQISDPGLVIDFPSNWIPPTWTPEPYEVGCIDCGTHNESVGYTSIWCTVNPLVRCDDCERHRIELENEFEHQYLEDKGDYA